jgi:hypothetical protein
MYPINELQWWQSMGGQGAYPQSVPFEFNHFPYLNVVDRQFIPGFPGGGGPMGPPPGFPGSPPPVGPPSQGPQGGPPTSPPPTFVPAETQQAEAFAVDPGSIRRCLFRFTYVWLRNFQQFWFYPTFVGSRSVSGYRWTGFNWVYFGINLRQIRSFTCI